MKKLIIIGLGFFAFSCTETTDTQNETNREGTVQGEETMDESVEIGSGEEINPQLEFETDSGEVFDVDTVTSPASIERQQQ